MSEISDSNTFTQRDLLQHLLQAAQHSVTREEMASQFMRAEQLSLERFEQAEKVTLERFEQAEKVTLERFEQVDKRFEQVDKRFDEIKLEIREQGKKHDRLSWAIFSGMLAILFKDLIVKALGI
ncbi:MAG: hypothetical protein IBX55_08225 [Methyloprofundus sp.]|nr:hypothetical protein [Methyloprofundus sp.]MBW6453349.1 hypothetical protein [Methyloprofundus sp.]